MKLCTVTNSFYIGQYMIEVLLKEHVPKKDIENVIVHAI